MRAYDGALRDEMAPLFAAYDQLVFFVSLGAVVRLRDTSNDRMVAYKLVGQMTDDESDEYIEVTSSSPIGVSLMRARIGEVVRVDLPRGEKRFEIVEIVE